jgi:hypothetical protein
MDRRWGWYALVSGLFLAVPGGGLAYWFLELRNVPQAFVVGFEFIGSSHVWENGTGYALRESFSLLFTEPGYLDAVGLFLIGVITATVGTIRLIRQSEEPESSDTTENKA